MVTSKTDYAFQTLVLICIKSNQTNPSPSPPWDTKVGEMQNASG